MAKMHLFTPEQKLIIDQVSKSNLLRSNFYFTGDTALSYFYLQHRYSEDLDFFSEKKFNNKEILSLMQSFAKKAGFTFRSELKEVVYMFYITFKSGQILKVDFGYYPHKRVEKGITYEGILVDSFLDIAINKLVSITHRRHTKDFVDLYFLLDKFTIWDLIEGVKVKFNMEIEPWILGSDLGYDIEKLTSLPKMIKPLTLEDLKIFFRKKAIELGRKSVK